MLSKTILVIGAAVLLAACVTPAPRSGAPSSSDRLRQTSMDAVHALAKSTGNILKTTSEAEVIEKAKASVSELMKDPDSAKFREVRVVDFGEGKVVCGEVNAKNSYGGYVGYKRFVAGPYSSILERTGSRYPEIDVLANSGLDAACNR